MLCAVCARRADTKLESRMIVGAAQYWVAQPGKQGANCRSAVDVCV